MTMNDNKPDYSDWKRWCFIRKGNTDCSPIVATIDMDGFIHAGNTDLGPIIATIDDDGFVHQGNTDCGPILYCIDWPFIRIGKP